jgi:hypothetical protein
VSSVCISLVTVADPSHRNKELPSEDLRSRFYEHYFKEIREYDKEFMKRNDDQYLNTALIFVSYLRCSLGTCVLTWGSGRSVLRCHFRVYRPSPAPAPTRPKSRDCRSPPRPSLQYGQHYVRWKHTHYSSMDRPSVYYHHRPSYALC